MITILGIDPSLKSTGYGFVEAENHHVKLLECGTIEPKPKELFQKKLEKIHMILVELISQYHPQVLILKKVYSHHKHPATVSILGHVRGIICLLCAQKNVELVEHSVKRIRQALIGNGNATKMQTRRVVASLLHVNEEQLTLDASDALALALGYV